MITMIALLLFIACAVEGSKVVMTGSNVNLTCARTGEFMTWRARFTNADDTRIVRTIADQEDERVKYEGIYASYEERFSVLTLSNVTDDLAGEYFCYSFQHPESIRAYRVVVVTKPTCVQSRDNNTRTIRCQSQQTGGRYKRFKQHVFADLPVTNYTIKMFKKKALMVSLEYPAWITNITMTYQLRYDAWSYVTTVFIE